MNVKILCLGALSLGKASGYDIGKRLKDPLGHFVDTAKSSVYPTLKALHEEGLVQYEDIEQTSHPNKKIFELTQKGKDVLKLELEALAPTHKIRSQYMLMLFFADMLSSDRIGAIIKERIQNVESFLRDESQLREYVGNNIGQQFLLDSILASAKGEKEYLVKNIETLLEKLDVRDK
ncbi:MAG: PadR family transcriptional regulator [Pseudohongiellaceae bacterium]